MEKQHPINEMMSTTMEKIRSMMDANTIIGDPIQTGEVTLIPVSQAVLWICQRRERLCDQKSEARG